MRNIILKKTICFFLGLFLLILILSFDFVDIKDEPIDPVLNEQNSADFLKNKNITDGPYIFYESNKIVVRWIKRNRLIERTITGDNSRLFKRKFGFEISPGNLKQETPDSTDYSQNFQDVEKFIAISDIHGQFDLFKKLLINHGVADENLNWNYGTGHLIVLGDIFDRGDKVTESLWLVYRLEEQALQAGGKVHYILGNHELMVLNNDCRYIHDKYISSANKMNMVYSQFYDENTFLGKWLRTKPVLVTINDILFVHAGISPEFASKRYTPEQTNRLFHENIIGKSWDNILNDSLSSFLMDDFGPIWYRGYFKSNVSKYQIDSILSYLNTKHIVVGHTSLPNIISFINGKIIAIDSSIKDGNSGEVLIFEHGEFYRGTSNGDRIRLDIKSK